MLIAFGPLAALERSPRSRRHPERSRYAHARHQISAMNAYTAIVLEAWPSEIEGPHEPATLEPTTKLMPPSGELAHAWAEMMIADGLADVENIDLLSRAGLRGAPLPLTQLAIPLDPHAQVE